MFVDSLTILVQAGKGGRGCVSFRREKFIPKGGPDGGDGGDGGSVYLMVDANLSTLRDLDNRRTYKAQNGRHGEGSNRTGASGDDLVLKVPPGTIVKDARTGNVLFDLVEDGRKIPVARGGKGGRGNARFATSTNRAPRQCDEGMPGEKFRLYLELKLLADAGIIGFPNAGKSTLISRISAAKPRIDDYPFTTLTPNLGVVEISPERSFVVADIPGLIEGAHSGSGLGIRFLKHVERTKVMVHVVDLSETGRDVIEDVEIIENELARFSPELAERPRIIAANKIDALRSEETFDRLESYCVERGLPFRALSAVTGEGVKSLIDLLSKRIATDDE